MIRRMAHAYALTCVVLLLCLTALLGVDEAWTDSCPVQTGVSDVVKRILCSVQLKKWSVPRNATALQNAGCLLGKKRCTEPMQAPLQSEVPESPPPPAAKNQRYQELATAAEQVVPSTWWRKGYADEKFLLTKNNGDFPRRMFEIKVLSNKKLRNMYECVTRQQFIRKSFDFAMNSHANISSSACVAMSDPVVVRFFGLWKSLKESMDGFVSQKDNNFDWLPKSTGGGELLMAAHEVLEYFYRSHGGIWTGCFAFERSSECRGALAGKFDFSFNHMHFLYNCTLYFLSQLLRW